MSRNFVAASSQYLEYTSGAAASGAPMSISAWFYVNSAAMYTMLNVNNSSSSTYYHWFYLNSTTVRANARDGSNNNSATTTTTFTPTTWNHALGVWAATDDRRAYLNGGGKGTTSTAVDPGTLNRMRVSNTWMSGNEYYLDGRLAEIGIWNVALTDAEALVLALGVSPLHIRPANLIAYWPLLRDTDRDLVGDYHLTPQNSPTVATHPPMIRYPRLVAPFLLAAAAAGAFTDRGIGRGIMRGIARGV